MSRSQKILAKVRNRRRLQKTLRVQIAAVTAPIILIRRRFRRKVEIKTRLEGKTAKMTEDTSLDSDRP